MRVKLQFLSTLVCLLGIAVGFACKVWAPQYWFDLYAVILIVFWIMEMIMSFVVERYEGKMDQATIEGGKWMKTYMVSKLIKVLVTLAFIVLGLHLSDDSTTKIEFAVCAVIFYLLNLAVETYVVTKKR